MNFSDLKGEVKKISFDAVRADKKDYFEAVVAKGKLSALLEVLDKAFGPPAWPSKKGLSGEIKATIDDFGGIENGQTLYYQGEGRRSAFAMLWPWQNGEQITLKLASAQEP